MISDCISDYIPPQVQILNMVIPILLHFCSFISNLSVASDKKPHASMKCDAINEVELLRTIL